MYIFCKTAICFIMNKLVSVILLLWASAFSQSNDVLQASADIRISILPTIPVFLRDIDLSCKINDRWAAGLDFRSYGEVIWSSANRFNATGSICFASILFANAGLTLSGTPDTHIQFCPLVGIGLEKVLKNGWFLKARDRHYFYDDIMTNELEAGTGFYYKSGLGVKLDGIMHFGLDKSYSADVPLVGAQIGLSYRRMF